MPRDISGSGLRGKMSLDIPFAPARRPGIRIEGIMVAVSTRQPMACSPRSDGKTSQPNIPKPSLQLLLHFAGRRFEICLPSTVQALRKLKFPFKVGVCCLLEFSAHRFELPP